MREESIARKNLRLLPKRIWKAEETDATMELYSYLSKMCSQKDYKKLAIMVVGAGGSYPAALAVSRSISAEIRSPYMTVATPQTAIRILTQYDDINEGEWNPTYDLIIGISYSGKTPDIVSVSNLSTKRGIPFLLLTGEDKEKLKDIYPENEMITIVSYYNPEDTTGKEEGMISMFSTLAPAVIADDNWTSKHFVEFEEYLYTAEKTIDEVCTSYIASALGAHPVIHVFYEWDSLPTAIDIETKFISSGIANVILHEKKNYSHGRFNVLHNQVFGLIINLIGNRNFLSMYDDDFGHYQSKYDKMLTEYLRNLSKVKWHPFLEIKNTGFENSTWNIKNMMLIPYLITAIGEELRIDISKPDNPRLREEFKVNSLELLF